MQSPSWETISHSANQEFPRLLWILKVHYRVHNSPPVVPILSHIISPYFRNIKLQNKSKFVLVAKHNFMIVIDTCEWSFYASEKLPLGKQPPEPVSWIDSKTV
jgi:hypothetical protein